jgi:hypothetical protein
MPILCQRIACVGLDAGEQCYESSVARPWPAATRSSSGVSAALAHTRQQALRGRQHPLIVCLGSHWSCPSSSSCAQPTDSAARAPDPPHATPRVPLHYRRLPKAPPCAAPQASNASSTPTLDNLKFRPRKHGTTGCPSNWRCVSHGQWEMPSNETQQGRCCHPCVRSN